MEVNPLRKGAKRVCEWLQSHGGERVSLRVVHQALRGSFPTRDDFMPVIDYLVDMGLVILEKASPKSGRGRNPSAMIVLADKFYAQNTHNSY